jgi:hypothetical protein
MTNTLHGIFPGIYMYQQGVQVHSYLRTCLFLITQQGEKTIKTVVQDAFVQKKKKERAAAHTRPMSQKGV